MLNVIDPRPSKPATLGPIICIGLGLLMVISAIVGAPDARGIALGYAVLVLGGGAFWRWKRQSAYARQLAAAELWLGDLQKDLDAYGRDGRRLPTVDSPIALRGNEVCHWVGEVDWQEIRSTTKSVSYAGPSLSIPIVKGVRYRVGSYKAQRVTATELQTIDSGRLVITSKRSFFDGRARNSTIEHRHLVGVGIHGNTLILDRSSGPDPRLVVRSGDSAMSAAVILARILTDIGDTAMSSAT